ncbi:hypothetical protein ACFLS0_05400 [Candidatus Bipolaricaulota bacterium]
MVLRRFIRLIVWCVQSRKGVDTLRHLGVMFTDGTPDVTIPRTFVKKFPVEW